MLLAHFQVRYLLEHIVLDVGEEAISDILIDNVARIAITQADEMAAQDGMSVQLEEESELCLPFVLPQDGYSSGFMVYFLHFMIGFLIHD